MISYSSNGALIVIIDVAFMKLLIGPRFHKGDNVVRWQHKRKPRIIKIQGTFMLKEKVALCRFRGRTNGELRLSKG